MHMKKKWTNGNQSVVLREGKGFVLRGLRPAWASSCMGFILRGLHPAWASWEALMYLGRPSYRNRFLGG